MEGKAVVKRSHSPNRECSESPTGKHEVVIVEPEKQSDGRENWGVVPGKYCVYCGKKSK